MARQCGRRWRLLSAQAPEPSHSHSRLLPLFSLLFRLRKRSRSPRGSITTTSWIPIRFLLVFLFAFRYSAFFPSLAFQVSSIPDTPHLWAVHFAFAQVFCFRLESSREILSAIKFMHDKPAPGRRNVRSSFDDTEASVFDAVSGSTFVMSFCVPINILLIVSTKIIIFSSRRVN
jgi:hypothetical protein